MCKITYPEKKLIILKEEHLNKNPYLELKAGRLKFHDISIKHVDKSYLRIANKLMEKGFSLLIEIKCQKHILQYNC